MKNNIAIIILAAGLGTRMKSDRAKVLHTVMGKPMINYVVEAAAKVAGTEVVVVTGHQSEEVMAAVSSTADVRFAFQEKQLGTGHAVVCAMPHVSRDVEMVVVLCGDVPLVSSGTIQNLINAHKEQLNDVTVLAINLDNPKGYGRMLVDKNGQVEKIVEEADATDEEKKITNVNSGVYCVKKEYLESALNRIKPDNAQAEFYLTDIVGIARGDSRETGLVVCSDSFELMGVNSLAELKIVESAMKKKQGKIS